MNEELLHFIDAEVVAHPDSPLPKKVKGALVNCYTFARSKEQAKMKVISALREDNYDILNIHECYEIDKDGMKECGELKDQDLDDLTESNGVFYGPFYTYEEQ